MSKILLTASLLLASFCFGQNKTWSKTKKLQWSDFQNPVKPTKEKDIVALTSTGIRYVVSQQKSSPGKVQVHISAIFNPKKSWKNNMGLNNQALDHEQGHFDIAEIYSRKIRSEVARQIITKSDFDSKFKLLYDRIYQEYQKFQVIYDQETNRGLNLNKQQEYREMINRQLN